MSKRVKLPATAKGSAPMKLGKSWRLVNPKRTRSLKAVLLSTYSSGKDRFAVFLVNR